MLLRNSLGGGNDSITMVPVPPQPDGSDSAADALARLRCGASTGTSAPPAPPTDGTTAPEPTPPASSSTAPLLPVAATDSSGGTVCRLLCGKCHAVIILKDRTAVARCGQCGRSVWVPLRIQVYCRRCSQRVELHPLETGWAHTCPGCQESLRSDDVLLRPRKRRSNERSSRVARVQAEVALGVLAVVVLVGTVLVTHLFF